MNNPKINVVVNGHRNEYHSIYKTYILKSGIPFTDQVIMPNTKYVIKYDFDLGGGAFDLDFSNADTHTVAEVTYYYIPFIADGSKYTLMDNTLVFIDAEWNGLSAREIKPEKGTLFMIASITGGLHKKGYGVNVVTVPENCIIEFDGGSLKNGTIIGQNTFYSDEGGLGDDVIFGKGIIKEGTWRKNFDPTNYYNKHDIDISQQAQDTEIAKKANSTDLATVATSGSYNDLIDKPDIPAMQVQSDWNQTGTSEPDYIKNKPTIPTVPTDVSAFNNDAGYLVSSDIAGKADKSDTYTKDEVDQIIEEVEEGRGSSLSNYYTKTQIDSQQEVQDAAIANKANSADLATVATSGDYDDLINKPTIPAAQVQSDWGETGTGEPSFIKNKPTNVSAFTNDAGYLTLHLDISGKADKSTLATVATSGSYTDLTDKPTIPEAQVLSDWKQTTTTAKDYIKNKPTIPTKTSELVNDSSFITSSDIPEGAAASNTMPKEDGNASIGSELAFARGDHRHPHDSTKADISSLANVATSGSYNDLNDKPTIPDALIQSNWNLTTITAKDYIKNKPTLATVATSGSFADLTNKPTYTKNDVGLGNVLNAEQIPASDKGIAGGVAILDSTGKVPSSQLPSYVDDIIEAASRSDFPIPGEEDKIYVAKDTNKEYRWGGTDYVVISETLAIGETSSTAFAGNRGKAVEDKLATIANGAEVNVLSDWTESDSTKDSYIQHKPTIPTKTSELTNDSDFITSADIPEGAAASSTTPLMDGVASVGSETRFARGDHKHPSDTSKANASDLETLFDDIKYIPQVSTLIFYHGNTVLKELDCSAFLKDGMIDTVEVKNAVVGGEIVKCIVFTFNADASKSPITVPVSDIINAANLATVATSGSYSDLSNKPTIPSKTSELTNDSNYITSVPVSSVAGKTGDVTLTSSDVGLGNVGNFKAVSTVASQGLTDKEKSNARTNIGAGTSSFSGSYNDLTDKPTIPCADKSYEPLAHSGLGRKNLELKNGNNVLTQQDFNSTNTIYVIAYDFDLNNQLIRVPVGCVLDFEGGSLDNGVIVGQDTVYINVGDVDIWGENLTRLGTWREKQGGSQKKVENIYDKIFDEHNLLTNPFFENAEGWTVENCSIENSEVSIVGKGNVSQEYRFVAKHVYMVVCYAKLDELHYDTLGFDYNSKAGIGFRVRSDETIQGAYRINIDNVSIEHREDYVPILFVFLNTVNCDAKMFFGEMYDTSGIAKGSIAHAALYDITDIYLDTTYERLYFEYKEWIEGKLGKFNASRQIVYPDSIAKAAFMERMNDAIPFYGMRYSRFGNPSGLEANEDGFNDHTTYKTTLDHVKVEEDTIYAMAGKAITSPGYNTYYFDVVSSNIYFASDVFIRHGNRVYIVTFWYNDTFRGWDPHFKNYVSNYVGAPERTDYREEILLSVPSGVNRIGITSNVGYVPVVKCYSQAPINASSAIVTARLDWHLKCNISTCEDIAKLVGVTSCDHKIQELLSVGDIQFAWRNSNGKGSYTQRYNADHYKDWRIIMKKGGASVPDPPGSDNYTQERYTYLAKNRHDGKCYSVAFIRQSFLPNYNDVDGTVYTDEQLKELYPERYARKQANNINNLLVSLLDYAHTVKREEIHSYPLVNGTIFSSDPEDPRYNTWIVSGTWYQAGLIDVEEYRGGNVIIAKDKTARYTFLTAVPVENELIQYADGYSTYVIYNYDVIVQVPENAKYLLVSYKEGDIQNPPYNVRLSSKEYDFSIIDWDACCVGEVHSDVPFGVSEDDDNVPNMLVDKYTWWYGEFYGKNKKMLFQPYSVTKLLTAKIALEYLRFSDDIVMNVSDFIRGSGYVYEDGETMKVSDAIFAFMEGSDNKIAGALSRIAGYEILKGRKLFLLDTTVEVAGVE